MVNHNFTVTWSAILRIIHRIFFEADFFPLDCWCSVLESLMSLRGSCLGTGLHLKPLWRWRIVAVVRLQRAPSHNFCASPCDESVGKWLFYKQIIVYWVSKTLMRTPSCVGLLLVNTNDLFPVFIFVLANCICDHVYILNCRTIEQALSN